MRSQKYEVAVKKDIPVMTEEWVTLVWEKGKEENVHATDSQFSKHKCPALMGITFTVSQVLSVLFLICYNLWDFSMGSFMSLRALNLLQMNKKD